MQVFKKKTRTSLSCSCYLALCVCQHFVTNSLQSHELQPARLLCPWNFPGKNTGVCCHFLLQGIFLTQESNPYLLHLLHWQRNSLPLCHLGSPSVSSNQGLDQFYNFLGAEEKSVTAKLKDDDADQRLLFVYFSFFNCNVLSQIIEQIVRNTNAFSLVLY